MKKQNKKNFFVAVFMLLAFILWTSALRIVDVRPIGPDGSFVGFASLNQAVHKAIGVNMTLYNITDWLGLVPIAVCFGFALLGLIQWIRRKKLKNVDFSIFVLGGFYVAVIAVYIIFETVVINYRPVLIDGYLEASYPSSTTMLVMCVMPAAIMQLSERIKNKTVRTVINTAIVIFIAFMVIGRLVSGVHWLSDIMGGVLLSAGLVMMYYIIVNMKK